MRDALPDINEVGNVNHVVEKDLCQSYSSMKNTSTFKRKHSNNVYQIKKNFYCNSKMMVYLIECRVCGEQCNGSTVKKFCGKANNAHIATFGKKKNCQMEPVTRNDFTKIISRATIMGFVTGRSQ